MVDYINYTIQTNDRLAKISQKNNYSIQFYRKLAEINNITNPDIISVGQVIKIPVKGNLTEEEILQKILFENQEIAARIKASQVDSTHAAAVDTLKSARKDSSRVHSSQKASTVSSNEECYNKDIIGACALPEKTAAIKAALNAEQIKNFYAISCFGRTFMLFRKYNQLNVHCAESLNEYYALQKNPQLNINSQLTTRFADLEKNLTNKFKDIVNHNYGRIANSPSEIEYLKPSWTTQKKIYDSFYSFNAITGAAVAVQFGAKAVENITEYNDITQKNKKSENAYYAISNIAQAANGWGIFQRSCHEVINRWVNPALTKLGGKQITRYLAKDLTNALILDPVTGVANHKSLRLPFFSTSINNFFLNEWTSGSILNCIFGLYKIAGDRAKLTRIADEHKKNYDARGAQITQSLNDTYVYGGGILHTLNEMAPYQTYSNVPLWSSWLLNRFTGWFQRALKPSYFNMLLNGKPGNAEYVMNGSLLQYDFLHREVIAEFDYTTEYYGGNLLRMLSAKATPSITKSKLKSEGDYEKLATLKKVEDTQESIRVGLNWTIYIGSVLLGMKYLKNYKFITSHWLQKVAQKSFNKNTFDRIESAVNMNKFTGTRTVWSKFIGGYMGFQVAHSAHQLASAAIGHNTGRADLVISDTLKGLNANYNPELLGRTGFADSYIANSISRFIHKNEIDKTLSEDKRRIKPLTQDQKYVFNALDKMNKEQNKISKFKTALWAVTTSPFVNYDELWAPTSDKKLLIVSANIVDKKPLIVRKFIDISKEPIQQKAT